MTHDDWVKATKTIREWVNNGAVATDRLHAELDFWAADHEAWRGLLTKRDRRPIYDKRIEELAALAGVDTDETGEDDDT